MLSKEGILLNFTIVVTWSCECELLLYSVRKQIDLKMPNIKREGNPRCNSSHTELMRPIFCYCFSCAHGKTQFVLQLGTCNKTWCFFHLCIFQWYVPHTSILGTIVT